MFLGELSHGSLQFAVAFVEVGRVEGLVQPERFGVGHLREVAGLGVNIFGFLAIECSHEERLVLLEDFMAVEVVEGFGCVLAGDLTEDDFTAGMGVDEFGDVVDFVVDDNPEVFFGGVLWWWLAWVVGEVRLADLGHFLPGKWAFHGGCGRRKMGLRSRGCRWRAGV